MFKNISENGSHNLCGKNVKALRLAHSPKLSQRGLADKLQLAGIDVDKNAIIHVYDENYQDTTDFKNAMSGVMLQYELATPTTTTIAENLTESQVMPLLEIGGSIEANGGSSTIEMVYKLINTTTTSEVLNNE